MTERVDERLMRIARYRTRAWADHEEYPDMLAEAYFRAWKSYQTAVEQGMAYPFQIAALGAAYGPVQWLERWYGRDRPGHACRRRQFEHVPLEEADGWPSPSPEALVLDRLEEEAAWERLAAAAARMNSRQREVLYRLFIRGESVSEVAMALGSTHQVIGKCRDRALSRCREEGRRRRSDSMADCTHCVNGHELTGSNRLVVCRQGRHPAVRCRTCQNESRKRCYGKHRDRLNAKRRQKPVGGQGAPSGAGDTA